MKTHRILIAALALITTSVHSEEEAPSLRGILKPAHAEALETAETQLRKLAEAQTEGKDAAAATELIALLDKPRQPAPAPDALVGEWKVRSLQAASYGVFSYPFFQCRIRQEGEIGLVFHKDTGSQRRLGNLAADGKTRFLFIGGNYVQGEPSRGYSAFMENPTADELAQDSFGYLYQLGPKHLLLVFADTNKGGEIYELKKP